MKGVTNATPESLSSLFAIAFEVAFRCGPCIWETVRSHHCPEGDPRTERAFLVVSSYTRELVLGCCATWIAIDCLDLVRGSVTGRNVCSGVYTGSRAIVSSNQGFDVSLANIVGGGGKSLVLLVGD